MAFLFTVFYILFGSAFLGEAKNRFKGELTLAHDGLEIDIPYTN